MLHRAVAWGRRNSSATARESQGRKGSSTREPSGRLLLRRGGCKPQARGATIAACAVMRNRWSRPTLHSHAFVDGAAILAMLLSPYVFGFSVVTSARNLFWTVAGCTAIYTLLTNYRGGLI